MDSPTSLSKHVISTKTLTESLKVNATPIADWSISDVIAWARNSQSFSKEILYCLRNEEIDGKVILALCENDIRDMRYILNYQLSFGDLKKLWQAIRELQEKFLITKTPSKNNVKNNCQSNENCVQDTSPIQRRQHTETSCYHHHHHHHLNTRNGYRCGHRQPTTEYISNTSTSIGADSVAMNSSESIDESVVDIPPEFFKTFLSLCYSFLVTWITSFVMVIVHERVPDMKRYPPLPDIFLDNVPHIPWAFHMCEITGTLLFLIWSSVCIFHKYRMVLLRRFFALAGTIFLLRCCTMLITSLSVPGTHLQCDQSDYAVDDTDLTLTESLELRISRAYTIWSGLGMSLQGVRTCGDYMFSGHTVALTLLNFLITEYTPRNLYFLHTLSWLLNIFGIFFILAAHEHYSIDVFVAFYITSRLFLYYHTLANNQALKSCDSTRTRIWFPLFSYFENSVDGIIPNEFDTFSSLLFGLSRFFSDIKDSVITTARGFPTETMQLASATKNLLPFSTSKQRRQVATIVHSTSTTATVFRSTPTLILSTETINNNSSNIEEAVLEEMKSSLSNDESKQFSDTENVSEKTKVETISNETLKLQQEIKS